MGLVSSGVGIIHHSCVLGFVLGFCELDYLVFACVGLICVGFGCVVLLVLVEWLARCGGLVVSLSCAGWCCNILVFWGDFVWGGG